MRAPPLEDKYESEILLNVGEEAVVGARGWNSGKIAALILIIVAEDQRAASIGERALISGDFSFGEIERIVVAAEVVRSLHQREPGRNLPEGGA